ncbi:MAG: hypothetical protein COV41_00090 [Candidatus Brennerbacteria bacterium CG11_big_fil_rev_8_21_14_0_20_43_10]|uniref:HTH psq-type domain-containing protein n=3 Tax=Candidatus Brenneribacteriota TaxID=1817902 RepID=A0A2M8C3D8_9BACT|nr:MAG: hypothetical protein AUJ43_01725 [Parcubacteria group bacterium CG1_02_44_31]PIP50313.1 MAG: hypothetical protein COX12_01880 [Candidatus Brennerbacteria bacterium CG23_combo_of_CG06-09_8_20_14_all_44_41]PIR26983.1 MAG: hypothetical protein COV41_00090 [Candidatus Brennerbacteria bacterium CG11_big_fil_rev_8_21_14_0_20_43_10]PIX28807.1 MAG: hypothetical protein COZ64_01885 [Candidatus Brennerbacteria bacterium CG_4_8_14_3_um_filter_43_14]PJA19328.1 MAG: hypothetical protein COX61_01525 
MRPDKQRAFLLRRENKSYNSIAKILSVPKSTLSDWFKKEGWSLVIKKRLIKKQGYKSRIKMKGLNAIAKQKREALYLQQRQTAYAQFRQYKNQPLFQSGLAIYWGEGDNKLENGIIRVANTDPFMLKLFHKFLKTYLPEIGDLIKAYLILYPDLNDNTCKKFWSAIIRVTPDRFLKSHYITGHHPTKRLPHGICTIYISRRAYKERICEWIELYKKEIRAMRV